MTAQMTPQLNAQQRKWVESAMHEVAPIARRLSHSTSHASADELQSAGYEGLVQAALRYDPNSGVPFPAYAHYRVRGAMIDAARRASPAIRRRSRALRALQATQSLLEQAERGEVDPQTADPRTLQERVDAAAQLVAQTTLAVTLARLAPKDPEAVSGHDHHDIEETVASKQLQDLFATRLNALPPADLALIQALYYEGLSMHEYAAKVSKAVSTISRNHARILKQMAATFAGRSLDML